MTCDRLFVYGTLRALVPNSKSNLFSEGATFLKSGRTLGKLFHISWHPAMIPGDAGEWVTGEVWKLHDTDATLKVLDEFEGPDYERMMVVVDMGDGAQLEAWAYLYKASVDGKARIESGDWADVAGTIATEPRP